MEYDFVVQAVKKWSAKTGKTLITPQALIKILRDAQQMKDRDEDEKEALYKENLDKTLGDLR